MAYKSKYSNVVALRGFDLKDDKDNIILNNVITAGNIYPLIREKTTKKYFTIIDNHGEELQVHKENISFQYLN
jgi:hypothetical protein